MLLLRKRKKTPPSLLPNVFLKPCEKTRIEDVLSFFHIIILRLVMLPYIRDNRIVVHFMSYFFSHSRGWLLDYGTHRVRYPLYPHCHTHTDTAIPLMLPYIRDKRIVVYCWCANTTFLILLVFFMYRSVPLCTLHFPVDFLNKFWMGVGGGSSAVMLLNRTVV